jgi:hypothetical protein
MRLPARPVVQGSGYAELQAPRQLRPDNPSACPAAQMAGRLFNHTAVTYIRPAVQGYPMRLTANPSRPPRRSNDGQAILKAIWLSPETCSDLEKRVELWGFEPQTSDRKITTSATARQRNPGPVTGGRSGWSGSGGLGQGDSESERFELADMVACLAVLVDAAGVVAGAQFAEAGGGVGEQVPDDDQDGAGDGD